ncbi:MAG: ATP-dependent helicase [Patescibacteria group bacterium]
MLDNSDLLVGLNKEQIKAVTHKNGPLLIVAGAGTGKTTVIAKRVAWLISQGLAKPEEILALTFTDKAAREMEERVDKLLPLGYVNTFIATFHSFGQQILQDYGLAIGLNSDFKVFSQTEQWLLVQANLDKFDLDYYRPLGSPTRFIHALLQHFSRAKDEAVYPEDYLKLAENKQLDSDAGEFLKKKKTVKNKKNKSLSQTDSDQAEVESEAARLKEVANSYKIYQQLLHDKGALDFGDLINYTLRLFRTRPNILKELSGRFKYILVDEFQDTNYAQYELIKLLAAPNNNITVVGDDDQSIYKFRGASLSNILEFKNDYPSAKQVWLTDNYRSCQNILDLSYKFIQLNNPYRLEVKLNSGQNKLSKRLKAQQSGQAEIGCYDFATAGEEADWVADKIITLKNKTGALWSDFAVLVRANSQADIFLQALKARRLPYEYVANRGLYSESIILDVVSYLKLLDDYHESGALYRVLSREPFALSQADLSALSHYAAKHTVSLYEAIKAGPVTGLSAPGQTVIVELQNSLSKHSALARQRSASEVYVSVVNDLGINERLQHPALVQEAAFLNSFYQRIRRFESEAIDKTLNQFLIYFNLEKEAGEQGQLPVDLETGPETVKVITAHSAKGLEWPYVFIVQLIDRRFPSTERREAIELPKELVKESLPEGDVHLQEERRLFYVALTRARQGLWLTRARDYLGKTARKPSRFLYELDMLAPVAKSTIDNQEGLLKEGNLQVPIKIESLEHHYALPETYSFSSVSAFKKCPLEFKYKFLLKLPMPGSGQMSFGSTIHKTLEEFLRMYTVRQLAKQTSLFATDSDTVSAGVVLPSWQELVNLYEKYWIDEWYKDKTDKAKYREQVGPDILKNFYEVFVSQPPQVKHLEKFFKIPLGPYKFVGKIDRLDKTEQGLIIIDYKTGRLPSQGLKKVDKDQLIIYQIAAQEFLRTKVLGARYWYLVSNQLSDVFLANQKEIDKLKAEYIEDIKIIEDTVKNNSFLAAHTKAPPHDCEFLELEV